MFASASWEHLVFASGGAIDRTRLEGHGYLGLIGQTVLVLRALREDADQPLPPYLKSLLGGWSSLRGFKAGSYVGDTLVTGSAELRVPLSSPLDVAKLGVSLFVDTGTAYDRGGAVSRSDAADRHRGQRLDQRGRRLRSAWRSPMG